MNLIVISVILKIRSLRYFINNNLFLRIRKISTIQFGKRNRRCRRRLPIAYPRLTSLAARSIVCAAIPSSLGADTLEALHIIM